MVGELLGKLEGEIVGELRGLEVGLTVGELEGASVGAKEHSPFVRVWAQLFSAHAPSTK